MPSHHQTSGETVRATDADSAIRHVGSHLLLWSTAGLALALDLWTKHWAFTRLRPDEVRPGLLGLVSYQRSLNDGALFGMGRGWVPLFIVASVAAVAFILYFFAGSRPNQRGLHVALACVLAGALGNMCDRTLVRADRVCVQTANGETERVLGLIVSDPAADVLQIGSWPDGSRPQKFQRERLIGPPDSIGVVRDFIKIQPIAGYDVWRWVFNVADVLLVVGVGMLFIGFARERRAVTDPAVTDASQS